MIVAAVFQGIFLLPMARMRDWKWEHIWLAFSLAGMIVFNWILTFISLPRPALLYAAVPWRELAILAGFGFAWGCGAVLFGLGMDMLGLTLGYPLIMGLNASVGTFVPLLWLYGGSMFAGPRLLISLGTLIAIAGFSACSLAGARREAAAHQTRTVSHSRFVPGLIIAIASGFLSCLPNIGLTFGTNTLRAAQNLGASAAFASNAVWFIFFSFGGVGQSRLLFLADDAQPQCGRPVRPRACRQLGLGPGHGRHVDRQFLSLRNRHLADRPRRWLPSAGRS